MSTVSHNAERMTAASCPDEAASEKSLALELEVEDPAQMANTLSGLKI